MQFSCTSELLENASYKGRRISMARARYVRCKIEPGLFQTEVYASVFGSSVYVDKSSVRITRDPENGHAGEGEILAYVIQEDAGGRALIELSGEPVVGGLRTWVPETAFAAA
jgi:hypothetical protein